MTKYKPTDAELEVLQTIWKFGPSTVKLVNEQLQELREVGYTTTLKIMQIMFKKGLLDREKRGKQHVYDATVSKETTQNQVIKKLADGFFHGSAMKLAMHALGSGKSSKEEIEEIRTFLKNLEDGGDK